MEIKFFSFLNFFLVVTCAAASDVSRAMSQGPKVFNSVSTTQPVIALTFDDGPHRDHTAKLLDILKQEEVPATFFVLGRNVQAHPQLVRRMAADGHEVGNHTWSHPALPSIGADRVNHELSKTSNIIQEVTGQPPTIMRPPYGALDQGTKQQIWGNHQMHIILWSVDPLDWKKPGAKIIRQRLVSRAAPGAILLAHDIHLGTIQAIPGVIQDLKSKGYQFVTVSQLLSLEHQQEKSPDRTITALPN